MPCVYVGLISKKFVSVTVDAPPSEVRFTFITALVEVTDVAAKATTVGTVIAESGLDDGMARKTRASKPPNIYFFIVSLLYPHQLGTSKT